MSSIQTNRWTPDTCSSENPIDACVVEFDVDTSTTPPTTFNFRTVRLCTAHSVMSAEPNEDTKVNAIRAENRRGFSHVSREILDNAPSSMYDISADGTRTFKQGITVTWNWTGTAPNRVLNVTVTGTTLTQNQLDSIRAKLDERFGINNVVLTVLAG